MERFGGEPRNFLVLASCIQGDQKYHTKVNAYNFF